MYRQNTMCGIAVAAFGFGILVGTWLQSGFACHLIGFGLIFLGLCVLRRH